MALFIFFSFIEGIITFSFFNFPVVVVPNMANFNLNGISRSCMNNRTTNNINFNNLRDCCMQKQLCHNVTQKQKFDVDSSNYIFATPSRSKYESFFPQQHSTSTRMNYDKGTPCNMI